MGSRVFNVTDVRTRNQDDSISTKSMNECKRREVIFLIIAVCAFLTALSAIVLTLILHIKTEENNPNRSPQSQLDEQNANIKSILKMLSRPSGNDTAGGRKAGDVNEQQNCQDILNLNKSAKSGVYTIYPTPCTRIGIPVYCDMTTQDGGWIVFQRRQDGSEDFYRGWEDYKAGFGNFDGEFWLGLNNLHKIVSSDDDWQLLVNMRFKGLEKYAMYKLFSIGPENWSYLLTVADYSGNAGDSLTGAHNGMRFSTKDRDNDRHADNCAILFTGAWWYEGCHSSNLNGVYGSLDNLGPSWKTFTGWYPVEFSEMKIKRKT